MKTIWTCNIHDGDFEFLNEFLNAIKMQKVKPDKVRFFCSGRSERCEQLVLNSGDLFSFEYRIRNDGFNRSFNLATNYAIRNGYDWLITIPARCIPAQDWLESLELDKQPKKVGMITTLIINNERKNTTFSLGHNISPSGGCFDFGSDLEINKVIKKATSDSSAIIGPCSGAGAYRTEALINNQIFVDSDDIVNSALFKSYNCDAISYYVLANGFENAINTNAISYKTGLQSSTSNNPNSLAINMNLEISRMTNILTYFEDWETSIELYEKEKLNRKFSIDGHEFQFKKSDLLMTRLFAQNMSRIFTKHKLKEKLARHLSFFSSTKDWYKKKIAN